MIKKTLRKYGLFFSWLISVVALLSTLYASEILQWPICTLCWYQRAALYPLVILLGIAAYRNEKHIIPYAYPFAVIGFIFAIYQYAEQMIPGFSPINLCTQGISCATTHIKIFGFITLPLLSAIASLFIFILLWSARSKS